MVALFIDPVSRKEYGFCVFGGRNDAFYIGIVPYNYHSFGGIMKSLYIR
jgi:hypothetical protein